MKEEERRILIEYQYYLQQIEVFKQNLEIITTSIDELNRVKDFLEKLSNLEEYENEILIPIGANSFIRAKLLDKKHVVFGVGSGIYVKKEINSVRQSIERRIEELEKVKNKHEETLRLLLDRAKELEPKVSEIVKKYESGYVPEKT